MQTKKRAITIPAVLAISAMLAVFVTSAGAAMLINAAGSTFGYPIYSKWFLVYRKVAPNFAFNYQSIGSGGGVQMLFNRIIEIGASDVPLSDEQLKRAPAPVLEFPSVLGGVVVLYNLPGFNGQLRLTGPLLAAVYLGKIVQWNDPRIEALNPRAKLPATAIVVCHRSDGSGTTFIFSDYLSKISPQWSKQVGSSTALRWPTGLGGKGSEGVTALVEQTPGAIGYAELNYALANHLRYAEIRNRAGNWVTATSQTVTDAAAGAAAAMPADFRVSITNAPGPDSYPISSFTWLLVYQRQADRAKGEAVAAFLHWMLTSGQTYAAPLYYAPLPSSVVKLEERQLARLQLPRR